MPEADTDPHPAPTTPGTRLRIVVVDAHELIRAGLREVFRGQPDCVAVGEADNLAEARLVVHRCAPDVVVAGAHLPDGSGLDLVRAIRRTDSQMGLVVLTMQPGDDRMFAAMDAGASAFVGKAAPSREVVDAARHAALAPQAFLCSDLAPAMARRARDERPNLSPVEVRVLDLLAEGLNTATIGRRLFLSESTTRNHLTRIYQKLGVGNRAQALVAAMRTGLLSPAPG